MDEQNNVGDDRPSKKSKKQRRKSSEPRRVLFTEDVARMIGCSAATAERMRYENRGPKWIRVGARNVVYLEAAVAFLKVLARTGKGRVDRGQTQGPALVMRQTLAALFELEEVLVMDAIENTAREGAAGAYSFIGGKHALLVYAPPSPSLMVPSAGYTFSWSGLLGAGQMGSRIKRFRMEHLASDRIEVETAFDQKLVSADLGFFFSGAVA